MPYDPGLSDHPEIVDAVRERWCVALALGLYLVFQLHATAFHGYWGQDFLSHRYGIRLAVDQPWEFLTRHWLNRTNPPLYHLIGALLERAVGQAHGVVALALANIGFSVAGAFALYGVTRRLITSAALRVAAVVFVLFLPVFMIHAQVVAADALATPLFWVLLWLVVRLDLGAAPSRFAVALAVLALVVVAGLLVKFTFGSVLVALAAWVGLAWWTRQVPPRRAALMLVALVAIPGACALLELNALRKAPDSFGFAPPRRLADASMTPRSIAWLRGADSDVLEAPPYYWRREGTRPLLADNRHSLPALLHLGVFTDLLNVYQHDPYDEYFGRRTERNHARMRWAVRTGVAFSLLAVAGAAVLLVRSASAALARRDPRALPLLALLLAGLAWLVNMVAPLPFVSAAYSAGFWHARLFLPALTAGFVAGFAWLDRLRWRPPLVRALALGAVLAQSALHASFLWPAPSGDPVRQADDDLPAIAAGAGAAFRVASWADGYSPNFINAYCLDEAMGVVIERAPQAPRAWLLSFDIEAGRSSPLARGAVRVSGARVEPATFAYQGRATVTMPLTLARGRNEVRIELLSPAPAPSRDVRVCRAYVLKMQIAAADGSGRRALRLPE